jgi:hypothetical protein
MKKFDCMKCQHYKYCKEPCPAASEYIEQDNIDKTWRKIDVASDLDQFRPSEASGLSTTENILIDYFINSMKPIDIAQRHYKSRQYVHKIIKKYSKLMIISIKKTIKNG